MKARDKGFLKAKPRLVSYLVEPTKDGPCGHLNLYRNIALKTMALFQRTDSGSSKPDVTDSLSTREAITALVIEEKDEDLYSMLAGQQLSSDADTKATCEVYARLVMGHENDDNCDKIIDALIREGFSIHATACR
jgi:hypothetical protein